LRATYRVLQDDIKVEHFGDPVTLWFFGDVHRDTRNCDVERWHWFLKKAKETMDANTYFIGMGDYHDFASTREKKLLAHDQNTHESTSNTFDLIAEKNNRDFAEEISFMRGHLLGLIEGNHSWVFKGGKTSTEDLAERMGTKDMGWLCHYTLMYKCDSHHARNAVHIVLCHGKAGGKTFGITINQIGDLKQIFPVADIYCMGHDHQRAAQPISILVPVSCTGSYQIKQKRQFLCRSGAFVKAYQDGSDSYEVFRLYRPSDLGALKMTIAFHRDQRDNQERVITDISAEI
jgi:hypothetical protein